jgi:hypothetical protein
MHILAYASILIIMGFMLYQILAIRSDLYDSAKVVNDTIKNPNKTYADYLLEEAGFVKKEEAGKTSYKYEPEGLTKDKK